MTNEHAAGRDSLVKWLRDAHAMELAAIDALDRLAERLSRHPQISTRLRLHCQEAREQVTRIESSLKSLNADPSRIKDVTTRLRVFAEAFTNIIASDEAVKDCLAIYALESYRVGADLSLAAAARELAASGVEQMCVQHADRALAMVRYLQEQIAETTVDHLRP